MRDAPITSIQRALRVLGLGAVLSGVLLGCGASGKDSDGSDAGPTRTTAPPSATTTTTAQTTETTGTPAADGGCPSTEAMADLLGGAVRRSSGEEFASNTAGLSYSVPGCDYDRTEGDASASVGRIVLTDAPEGAPFDLLQAEAEAAFATDGFEAIPDLGDDAYRHGSKVAVLHGSKLLFVGAEGGTDGDGTDLLPQTEAVAAGALELDLTTDLATLCPQFQATVATAMGPVDETVVQDGGAIMIDDVDIETAGCEATLADGTVVEVNIGDGAQWDAWVAATQKPVYSVGYAEVTVGERNAFDDGEALVVDDGDKPLRVTTEDLDGDPDEAAAVRVQIAELVLG